MGSPPDSPCHLGHAVVDAASPDVLAETHSHLAGVVVDAERALERATSHHHDVVRSAVGFVPRRGSIHLRRRGSACPRGAIRERQRVESRDEHAGWVAEDLPPRFTQHPCRSV